MTQSSEGSMSWRSEKNKPKRKFMMLLKRNKQLRNPWKGNKRLKRGSSNSSRKSNKKWRRNGWTPRVQKSSERKLLPRDAKRKKIKLQKYMQSRAKGQYRGKNTSLIGKQWSWHITRPCISRDATVNWASSIKNKVSINRSKAQYLSKSSKPWNQWVLRSQGKRKR